MRPNFVVLYIRHTVIPNTAVLALIERETIRQALFWCDGNISHTAEVLGIYRQTLQRKIRKFGL